MGGLSGAGVAVMPARQKEDAVMVTFDPMADLIDLRDVVEILEPLVGEGGNIDRREADDDDHAAYEFMRAIDQDLALHNVQESDAEILRSLRELADNEPTVIARRYFVEYAQELASDTWGGPGPAPWDGPSSWPAYCISWEYAARELEVDYSSFWFDGREYLIRNY